MLDENKLGFIIKLQLVMQYSYTKQISQNFKLCLVEDNIIQHVFLLILLT